jgi:hypothetical protein
VVVASGEKLLADVLDPVYDALGLEWRRATSGSASAELGRELSTDELMEALIAELAESNDLVPADVDEVTVSLAHELLERDRVSLG